MKYEDSSCTWDMLANQNAFSIERHALKITQPLEPVDGGQRIACPNTQRGRRFGRIDFSKGFSDWWFLSHIDLKVPSEHYQEGKRYSAEAQMYHFYSISGEAAGVDNEVRLLYDMAGVSNAPTNAHEHRWLPFRFSWKFTTMLLRTLSLIASSASGEGWKTQHAKAVAFPVCRKRILVAGILRVVMQVGPLLSSRMKAATATADAISEMQRFPRARIKSCSRTE